MAKPVQREVRKRVAVVGFSHETNVFSRLRTEYSDFVNGGLFYGDELVDKFEGSRSVVAGFLEAAKEFQFEAVPLFFARAEPLGPIASRAAGDLVDEIIAVLSSNAKWDGVLLALHGAAVSDEELDLDGLILARVRDLVGDNVAIGVVFDMHANVSPRMIENCTFAVVYRTNPHLDTFDRGLECGRLMGRWLQGQIAPVQAHVRLPLIIGITRSDTSESPMRELLDEMEAYLRDSKLLSASIAEGFPWADVPDMGMSVIVVADGDSSVADSMARRLAKSVWNRRFDMIEAAQSPERAMEMAANSAGKKPVGVLDVGDNIGGGGGGDSTELLSIAIRERMSGVVGTIYDAEAAKECISSGVGAAVNLSIGGHIECQRSGPLIVTGTVVTTSDGRFEDTGPTHEGYRFFDAGPTAVLALENGILIVLTSKRVGNVSQMQFRGLGIPLEEQRVLVLKGVNAPRGTFHKICSDFIVADTPGSTSINLRELAYKHACRPIFPLDDDANFD